MLKCRLQDCQVIFLLQSKIKEEFFRLAKTSLETPTSISMTPYGLSKAETAQWVIWSIDGYKGTAAQRRFRIKYKNAAPSRDLIWFGSLNIVQAVVVPSHGHHDRQTLPLATSMSGSISKIMNSAIFPLPFSSWRQALGLQSLPLLMKLLKSSLKLQNIKWDCFSAKMETISKIFLTECSSIFNTSKSTIDIVNWDRKSEVISSLIHRSIWDTWYKKSGLQFLKKKLVS